MINNEVNNQKKLNNAFNVCRYIAVVFGLILLSAWTVKSPSVINLPEYELTQATFKEITGVVKTEDGEPISGVTVWIVGSHNGTDTDIDGRYSLSANEGDRVSFYIEGFKKTTITVRAGNIFNITMIEDDSDELLHVEISCCYPSSFSKVPPHGTLAFNDKTIEGEPRAKSVSTNIVDNGRPIATLLQTLTSPFMPLFFNVDMRPSEAYRNPETILKDVENLTRNGNYTYIVDGVRVSEETFRSLNQNDVESVDIYKHTDVYNARFGNKENQSRISLNAR